MVADQALGIPTSLSEIVNALVLPPGVSVWRACPFPFRWTIRSCFAVTTDRVHPAPVRCCGCWRRYFSLLSAGH